MFCGRIVFDNFLELSDVFYIISFLISFFISNLHYLYNLSM